MKYPECTKLANVAPTSQAIGEFMNWLSTKDIVLASWHGTTLHPRCIVIQDLLAEFFNIDMNKVEDERRQILDNLKGANCEEETI